MIPFLKYRKIYFALSGVLLLVSIYALFVWGVIPSIDFTGGTLVEFQFHTKVSKELVEDILREENINYSSIQASNETNYLIRSQVLTKEQIATAEAKLASRAAEIPQKIREEIVGPTIGGELLRKMAIAAGLAIFAILIYVAYAFKNATYGLSAIVALLHDTVILFGAFSLLGHFRGIEVDALFVTAVLTTMSFSVHDTIVVFDRIREKIKDNSRESLQSICDQSLSETMTRSVNNSLTIIFMLLALFLLGGETIKWFVFALLVGTISGTYSSPFVATPVLYELQKWREKRNK